MAPEPFQQVFEEWGQKLASTISAKLSCHLLWISYVQTDVEEEMTGVKETSLEDLLDKETEQPHLVQNIYFKK